MVITRFLLTITELLQRRVYFLLREFLYRLEPWKFFRVGVLAYPATLTTLETSPLNFWKCWLKVAIWRWWSLRKSMRCRSTDHESGLGFCSMDAWRRERYWKRVRFVGAGGGSTSSTITSLSSLPSWRFCKQFLVINRLYATVFKEHFGSERWRVEFNYISEHFQVSIEDPRTWIGLV